MTAILKQERNLLITAKILFAVGLFFTVDAIYTSFGFTFNAFWGTLGAILFLLILYWSAKSFKHMTERYDDEYLKHVYQTSYRYAATGAVIALFVFMLFDDWLAHYFTLKYAAKLCIGCMFGTQGGYILWRNFKDNQDIENSHEYGES